MTWPQPGACDSLLYKIPVAVSMSMNQSSSFKQSCLPNVGIFLEHSCGEAWFSLCCMQGVHVSLHGFVHWFLTGLGGLVRCCSLSVCCDNSAVGVELGVLDFKLANWSLCWQNCSNSSAKEWWVSVSSQYSSEDSLSPSSIGCSGGTRSSGGEFWMTGMSSVSWLPYLVTMPCVLCCVPKSVWQSPLEVIVCGLRTCAVAVVVQVIGG